VQSRLSAIARHQAAVQRGVRTYHGLHCSALDPTGTLRLHNPESAYYRSLANQSKGLKRLYYLFEAWALRRWEQELASSWTGPVHAITARDAEAWNLRSPRSPAAFVAPRHPFVRAIPQGPAAEPLVLVVGKFSVEENAAALRGLLSAQPAIEPLLFAGHNAPAGTKNYLDRPSDTELDELYARAQVVVVHAEHQLGIKFKLIQALMQGRHIVAHEDAVAGLNLGIRVRTYRTWPEAYEAIRAAQSEPWTAAHAEEALRSAQAWQA
jgi:hypothetical protein